MKPAWPADAVERRSVEELVPYARNARTHSAEQVEQIAASIREWGWTVPVLIDEDSGIIAGHGRVMAAQLLGLADIPVMIAAGWTKAQKRAYVLADNKLALNAAWDDGVLKFEIEELSIDGFDLALTGFSEHDIDLLNAPPDIDPEAEWQGMPEFNQPDNGAFQSLVVHFKDQDAVDTFARLIGQVITGRTKFAWFPLNERERSADKPVYVADAA